MYGFDLDIDVKPSSADMLHAGVEYLNSRYGRFTYFAPGTASSLPPPVTGVTTGCAVAAAPAQTLVDCTGETLLAAPRWTGSAAWEHTFPFESGASVRTHLDVQYAGSRWLAIDFLAPQERAPAYIVESVSVRYSTPHDRWQFAAFIHNLSNRPVYSTAFENPFYPGVAAGIGDPRTYGGRLTLRF
jgi:iron complex outermembrane recepter protein